MVIAILCSDIHLSHRPPVARSAEPDWYAAMKRGLDQLRELSNGWDVPIICAGDVFDRWDSPAELINFASKEMPVMYAIPGQHDLPNHSIKNVHRSAFQTLVDTGVINSLSGEWVVKIPVKDCTLSINCFPWGFKPSPRAGKLKSNEVSLCVAHQYIWCKGHSYPNAPKDKHVKNLRHLLEGYSACAFGDNHKGFHYGNVLNCGTFFRRKIDEIGYKPHVGLLHEDGTIELHYLDCSEDLFIDADQALTIIDKALDATEIVKELAGVGKTIVDFAEAVKQFCVTNNIDIQVRNILKDVLEK